MSQQEIDSVVSDIVMKSIMGLWISWIVGIVVSMLTWSTCQCQHGQPHVTFHKILLQFSKGGCSGLSGDSTEGGYSLTYNDSQGRIANPFRQLVGVLYIVPYNRQ